MDGMFEQMMEWSSWGVTCGRYGALLMLVFGGFTEVYLRRTAHLRAIEKPNPDLGPSFWAVQPWHAVLDAVVLSRGLAHGERIPGVPARGKHIRRFCGHLGHAARAEFALICRQAWMEWLYRGMAIEGVLFSCTWLALVSAAMEWSAPTFAALNLPTQALLGLGTVIVAVFPLVFAGVSFGLLWGSAAWHGLRTVRERRGGAPR